MSKLKKHLPHPDHYPKASQKDGDIGWCGRLWCKVIEDGEEPTCKACLKLMKRRGYFDPRRK